MASQGEAETLPADTLPADAAKVASVERELPVVDATNYQLGEELARGGFGRLLRARDRRLDREVAIKQLRATNAQLEARFRLEARITARLSHPAVVPVHEVGRWPSGEPFYAMKLVTGRSLRAVLDATPALADRLALVPALVAVVDAVGYAHREGILHRDIKPGNIMIEERDGRRSAFVVDWGLAKDTRSGAEDSALEHVAELEPGSSDLTAAGSVLGTPPYLAPEQARGEPVDERADVYSIGALLYELVAGSATYTGATAELLAAVANGPPPPALAKRQPAAPLELVAIVERALAREQAARYANATEVADELRRFERGELVHAYRYTVAQRGWRWVRRHRALVLACIAIATAVALTVLWLGGRTSPAWRPVVRPLEAFEENSNGASFSPDGTMIVFPSDRTGEWSLWLGPVDGAAHRVPTEPGRAAAVRFARDGKSLLYRSMGDLYRVPLTGGRGELVARGVSAFDDCGERIIASQVEDARCDTCLVQIVSVGRDGDVRALHRLDIRDGLPWLRCDARGMRIVYTTKVRYVAEPPTRVWQLALDGTRPRFMFEEGNVPAHPTFHPDGKSIIYSSRRAGAINLWELWLADGTSTQLTFGGGPDIAADIARDGSKIVFDVDVTVRPLFELVLGQTAPSPKRLTPSLGDVAWAVASADGTRVVYEIARDGAARVGVLSLATGEERLIAEGNTPVFGPGDAEIYFVRGDLVMIMPAAGGPSRELARLPSTIRGIIVDRDRVVHAWTMRDREAEAWRIAPDGFAEREAPAGYFVVIPSPTTDWRIAMRPEGFELVPPGVALGAATNRRFAHSLVGWDFDGTSVVYGGPNHRSLRRHHIHTARDEELITLTHAYAWAAVSPDRNRFFITNLVGRVRRQLITNFAERPR